MLRKVQDFLKKPLLAARFLSTDDHCPFYLDALMGNSVSYQRIMSIYHAMVTLVPLLLTKASQPLLG